MARAPANWNCLHTMQIVGDKVCRRNLHSREVLPLLGIKPGHLPAEGMAARVIQGITVWVTPMQPAKLLGMPGMPWTQRMVKSSTHRVMGRCPACGWEGSVGRMHQHKCKPTPTPPVPTKIETAQDPGNLQWFVMIDGNTDVDLPYCENEGRGGDGGILQVRRRDDHHVLESQTLFTVAARTARACIARIGERGHAAISRSAGHVCP